MWAIWAGAIPTQSALVANLVAIESQPAPTGLTYAAAVGLVITFDFADGALALGMHHASTCHFRCRLSPPQCAVLLLSLG